MSYRAALLTVIDGDLPASDHRAMVDRLQTKLAQAHGSLEAQFEVDEDRDQIVDHVAEIVARDIHVLIVTAEDPDSYETVFEALDEADFDADELEAAYQLRHSLLEAAGDVDEDKLKVVQIEGVLVFTLPGETDHVLLMADYLAPLLDELVESIA